MDGGGSGVDPSWRWVAFLRDKTISALWTLLALLAVLYGNGEHDLITLVLFTRLCSWPFIAVGLTCWGINAGLFLYVCIWLQGVKGIRHPLDDQPWAVQSGAACFATAFVSLTLGVWPVFGFLSPLLVVTVTYGMIMGLSFVPHFGLLRPRAALYTSMPFSSASATRTADHAKAE